MANPSCPGCGTEIGPGLLACLRCGRLVHSDELKLLAAEGEEAERRDDLSGALAAFRRILEFLPQNSKQHAAVVVRIEDLGRRLEQNPGAARNSAGAKKGWKANLAGLGALGILVATKGKFLLLGLSKAGTFLSMILALGVYWSLWGWKFALGFIVCTYIHEMGHVWMLRRYGFRATAPMFIPGLGALIRLQQKPSTAREDARIGLAGPTWGLASAAACWGIYLATGLPIWGALARFNAWVNLFNLFPVWQLDGGRGFNSLTRLHRWIAAATIAAAYFFIFQDGLVILLLLGAVGRAFQTSAPKERDTLTLVHYMGLLILLALLCTIHVPLPGMPAPGTP